MSASHVRALMPWWPTNLARMLSNLWAEHGDMDIALGHLRQTNEYAVAFPGIRRDDGSLRMSEQEYLSHREAFRREFTQWGLNPSVFEGHHRQLIEGEVTVAEFRQRLGAFIPGVIRNLPSIREEFGRFYGIDAMDDRALVAAAIDPQVGLDILAGRMTAAQVAAEASARGFTLERERAEQLSFRGGGLDQESARRLFSEAQRVVPTMQRLSTRFNAGPFGRQQFEEASVFGVADEQQRMRRLAASEGAMFRQGGQIAGDRSGLTGLQRQ